MLRRLSGETQGLFNAKFLGVARKIYLVKQ